MKNLLLGAIALLIFSLSLLVIQSSCSKSDAQSTSGSGLTQLNKLIYKTDDRKLWICNYDGSNATPINLTLPSGVVVDWNYPRFSVKLSPDGKKIFFSGYNTVTNAALLCSTDISGNGYIQIAAETDNLKWAMLCGAY